jgi:hypothetical protein
MAFNKLALTMFPSNEVLQDCDLSKLLSLSSPPHAHDGSLKMSYVSWIFSSGRSLFQRRRPDLVASELQSIPCQTLETARLAQRHTLADKCITAEIGMKAGDT